MTSDWSGAGAVDAGVVVNVDVDVDTIVENVVIIQH